MRKVPENIWEAYWSEAKPGTEAALERVIDAVRADMTKEHEQARQMVAEANNSLYGSHAYFHSLNGGEFDKYHLAKGIEALKPRPCTCHPNDNPPRPCAQRHALSECRAATTPTAFNWTPQMQAIWPREMRPTMTGLLAMWEALQGAAEYSGSQAVSDAPRTCWNGRPLSEAPLADDGWIEWGGGVMPVFPGTQIAVRHRGGEEHTDTAGGWYSNSWGHDDVKGDIIAYRVVK